MAGIARIPEALTRVREEQTRTAAEQEAFEAFATRIQTMAPGTTPVPPTPEHGRVLTDDSSTQTGIKMARVREAYRETVMATPHYIDDYDEPLVVNVREEFGPELATTLTHGDSLTPPLQQTLLKASQKAADNRTAYQKTLKAEYEALQAAKRRLRTLTDTLTQVREQTNSPKGFTDLLDAHNRAEALKTDCVTIIEDRQTTLANRPQYEHHRLPDYLYKNQEWTYPIIGDVLDCRTQIQELERKLIRAITHHP